ncbi:lipase class 3 [Nitzschia inconspicua]|uniref:Lipase class 3 n=1 Tax=Nitzschia inconspicua TaxID=303405 RepID=A0A9K3PJJ9_9STRA|nr:lipase class 3 [Nitzschia inconspicua]
MTSQRILFLFLTVAASCMSWLQLTYANNIHFADQLPTLHETQEMAKLSLLVYKFRYHRNFTCDNFPEHRDDETIDIDCHFYLHDEALGTQVLLVSNDVEKYISVVFAGTDDIRTSLQDANIFTKPFGNNDTIFLKDPNARVHAGFNNAVFTDNIWNQVYNQTKALWYRKTTQVNGNDYQLYTTGHSLGAANSMLIATAFATMNNQFPPIKCINFGGPQTGNADWMHYFNSTSHLRDQMSIFRVVLAWDLVARLPEFFYHAGHTVQIDGKTNEVRVYYEHYGNEARGYAGAPTSWYSRSYAWLPFALDDHHIRKYVRHLQDLNETTWAKQFFPTDGTVYDDDQWANPPDDWIQAEEDVPEKELLETSQGEQMGLYQKLKRLLFER